MILTVYDISAPVTSIKLSSYTEQNGSRTEVTMDTQDPMETTNSMATGDHMMHLNQGDSYSITCNINGSFPEPDVEVTTLGNNQVTQP